MINLKYPVGKNPNLPYIEALTPTVKVNKQADGAITLLKRTIHESIRMSFLLNIPNSICQNEDWQIVMTTYRVLCRVLLCQVYVVLLFCTTF